MARRVVVVVVGEGMLECLPGLIKFDLAEVRDYCRVKGGKRRHHTVHFRQVDAARLRVRRDENATSSASKAERTRAEGGATLAAVCR